MRFIKWPNKNRLSLFFRVLSYDFQNFGRRQVYPLPESIRPATFLVISHVLILIFNLVEGLSRPKISQNYVIFINIKSDQCLWHLFFSVKYFVCLLIQFLV